MAGILSSLLAVGLSGCRGDEEEPEEILDGEDYDNTDPNAPKKIDSTEIADFYTYYWLETRWKKDENHEFEFEVRVDDNGTLMAYEHISEVSVPADEALLGELQKVIEKYGLVKKNGVYRVNYSLSPEYQKCVLRVNYRSGEKLSFTDLNDPAAHWEEEFYTVLADHFAKMGEDSLYPEKETSQITRLDFDYMEDSVAVSYGAVKISGSDGEKVLNRSVYDYSAQKPVSDESIPFPEDYFETLTEILFKYDIPTRYMYSYVNPDTGMMDNHDIGYYVWGSLTPADGEEDSQDRAVSLYIEYESGERLSIETRKASEINAMKPMLDELQDYYGSLFDPQ